MLPAVIVAIIGLILELMFLILLPILGAIYYDDIQNSLDDKARRDHTEPLDASIILCSIWILFAIWTGSLTYLFVNCIKCSLLSTVLNLQSFSFQQFNIIVRQLCILSTKT